MISPAKTIVDSIKICVLSCIMHIYIHKVTMYISTPYSICILNMNRPTNQNAESCRTSTEAMFKGHGLRRKGLATTDSRQGSGRNEDDLRLSKHIWIYPTYVLCWCCFRYRNCYIVLLLWQKMSGNSGNSGNCKSLDRHLGASGTRSFRSRLHLASFIRRRTPHEKRCVEPHIPTWWDPRLAWNRPIPSVKTRMRTQTPRQYHGFWTNWKKTSTCHRPW